jgi:hypothetical protein
LDSRTFGPVYTVTSKSELLFNVSSVSLSGPSMQDTEQQLLSQLPRLALETYHDEYRDLSDTWRNLDTKAQGLGALAGIFVAAVFAWSRQLPEGLTSLERLVLAASVVLLILSIVAAVLALLVRRVPAPPLGEETADMIRDILQEEKPSELLERVTRFYNDQIRVWHATNCNVQSVCLDKAFHISVGQVTILLAAVAVSLLALKPIFSSP